MLERALVDKWPWLAAGIALALAYWTLSDSAPGELWLVALKAGSVLALAGYARFASRHRDARGVAAVMAIGAAGDAAIEFDTIAGGAFFLLSHLAAIVLYRRNARPRPGVSQRLAAMALLLGVPLAAWLLSRDPFAVIYAAVLGAMAGAAWLSRFSRYRVGIGALLFVASDLLIFARLGGTLPDAVTAWLIWPLYYSGQFLVVTGVIGAVRRDQAG
ncbi:MAG: lysoplasmalogenase family protein [Cypionkella sp.]